MAFNEARFSSKTCFRHTNPLRYKFSCVVFFWLSKPGKGLLVLFSIRLSGLQLDNPASCRMDQLSWYKQEPIPDSRNHGFGPFLTKCFLFEQIHEIVSQHQQLKPCAVSSITMGDHFVQTKTVNTFLDEVFTTCPLIIKPLYLLRGFVTISNNHLVIESNIFNIKKPQLLPGFIINSYLFSDYYHPQRSTLIDNVTTFTNTNAPSDALPLSYIEYLALNPRLHGHHNGKLNTLLYKVANQIMAKNPLSALLGIIFQASPLLISINRDHMGVQVKTDLPQTLVPLPQLHDKIKIQRAESASIPNPYRFEKPTDGRLNRKTTQSHYLLEHLINTQNPHLIRPAVAKKHSVKTANKHSAYIVLALSTAFYLDILIKHLLNRMTLEKTSDHPTASKAGQVAVPYLANLSIAFYRLSVSLFECLLCIMLNLYILYYYFIWRHSSLYFFEVHA